MLRQRIAELKSAAAVKAAETEGLRAAAAGENERLRRRLADLERQHAERQKRVGVLQTASMNASVENERLLQRLRAAEKPSLASAAESEKLGKRIAQLECDAREAAAKHHRESDELRLHCAQLAQQAQTAVAARDVAILERDAAIAAKRAVPIELRRQYDALEKQLVVALTKLERSTRREDQRRRAFAASGKDAPLVRTRVYRTAAFRVRERELDVVRDARGHLEIGAVVVEVVDGRADEHADAHGLEARAPDGG